MHQSDTSTRLLCQRFIIATLVIILPFWWVLFTNPYLNAADLSFYAIGTDLFAEALFSGDVYPRWLFAANDGEGSPVFVFYPPLSAYITSLFYWMDGFDPLGQYRYLASMTLAILMSGICFFLWLRHHTSPTVAAIASILFILGYYRQYMLYFQNGLAMQWALAIIPFIFYLCDRLHARGAYAAPLLTLGMAALLLTHIPGFILTVPIAGTYLLLFSHAGRRGHYFLVFSAALFIAASISSFYWLPAMLSRPFIGLGGFTTRLMPADWSHVREYIPLLLALLSALAMWKYRPGSSPKAPFKRLLYFFGGAALLAFPLFLPGMGWLWTNFTPLHYLQFPERLFPFLQILFALLIASWLPECPRITRIGIYILTLSFMVVLLAQPYWRNTSSASLLQGIYALRFIHPEEYIPKWVKDSGEDMYILKRVKKLESAHAAQSITVITGAAQVTTADERNYTMQVSSGHATFTLRHHYFPHLRLVSDTKEWVVLFPAETGVIRFSLPKGTHMLTLQEGPLPFQHISNLLSSMALAVFFLWLLSSRQRARNASGAVSAS